MGFVSGAIQMVQGIGSALSANGVKKAKNKVYKEQYKTAQMRSEFNEKEIQRAYKENYANTLYAYGEKVGELTREFNLATDAVLTNNVANLSSVEMGGSSFHQTAMQEARKERDDAVRNIIENQSGALKALSREKENMRTENKLALYQASYQKNLGYLQNKAEKDVAIVNGITDAMVGLASMMGDKGSVSKKPTPSTIGDNSPQPWSHGIDTSLRSPLLEGAYKPKISNTSGSFTYALGGGKDNTIRK